MSSRLLAQKIPISKSCRDLKYFAGLCKVSRFFDITFVGACSVTEQASMKVCENTAMDDDIVSGFSISNTDSGFFSIVTQNRHGRLKNYDIINLRNVYDNQTTKDLLSKKLVSTFSTD